MVETLAALSLARVSREPVGPRCHIAIVRLPADAAAFLLDLLDIDEKLRRSGRVDAILLIQTGPRYGLKPGPPAMRTAPHPGLVDELEGAGFVRTEPSATAARKFRLTGAGIEFAQRLAGRVETDISSDEQT